MNFSYDSLDLKRRFSTMDTLNSALFSQLAKSRLQRPLLRKSSSLVIKPQSNKSSRVSNKLPKSRNVSIVGVQKSDSLIQVNKKLLSDICVYRKQIENLKIQNKELRKYKKEYQEKYKTLKQIHLQMVDNHQQSYKQEKHFQRDHDEILQILQQQDSEIISVSGAKLDSNFNIKMIMSRQLTPQHDSQYYHLELKLQSMQKTNQDLKKEIKQLKQHIAKSHYKQNNKIKNIFSFSKQYFTQTEQQIILICSPSKFQPSQKQIYLQTKIDSLQKHIWQTQKRHTKLKDRCHTLRNLMTMAN